MNTNDYRRKMETAVAKARARRSKALAPKRGSDGLEAVTSRKASAKSRIESLGRMTSAEGPDAACAGRSGHFARRDRTYALRLRSERKIL